MRLRYHFHSLTVIIILLAVSPLIWLNFNPPTNEIREIFINQVKIPENLDPVTRYFFYKGWPFSPYQLCLFHGNKWHPEDDGFYVYLPLLINFFVIVFGGVVSGIISEWCLRRQTPNGGEG